MNTRVRAYVGLGSNLGNRERRLRQAVQHLVLVPETEVAEVSSFYDSDPVGDPGHPAYLNAVAALDTRLSPEVLAWNLFRIEGALGRSPHDRGAPRPIDLDLLFHGRTLRSDPRLVLPHPRYAERPFVLVPLVELDPGWIDPCTGLRMDELLRRHRRVEQVRWRGKFSVS